MRRSFSTASFIEYQTKKTSRKISPTMGTLSGLVMMSRKFGSRPPSPKNSVKTASAPYPNAFEAIFSRFQTSSTSERDHQEEVRPVDWRRR